MTHKVFYTDVKVDQPGLPMIHILKSRPVAGDVGIEIECEGNTFRRTELPIEWVYHKDGSLRGADNAEYVFKKPLKFAAVPAAINNLWDMFKTDGTELDVSNRTSVHVHLNMQKFHMNRLCAFVSLYFAVEEILTEWCGDHRIGNLFCLRARDASAIVTQLKKFIQSDGRYEIREGMHYAGLNAQALYKFGSIEIRTMRGVSDPETILDWVAILERLYVLSAEYPDPRVIPSLLSSEGPMAFLDMVLGDKAHTVRSQVSYTPDRLRTALYDGIRLAQDLCYCRDWSDFTTATKIDPFSSNRKPISAQIGMPMIINQIPSPFSQFSQFSTFPPAPAYDTAVYVPSFAQEYNNEGDASDDDPMEAQEPDFDVIDYDHFNEEDI